MRFWTDLAAVLSPLAVLAGLVVMVAKYAGSAHAVVLRIVDATDANTKAIQQQTQQLAQLGVTDSEHTRRLDQHETTLDQHAQLIAGNTSRINHLEGQRHGR